MTRSGPAELLENNHQLDHATNVSKISLRNQHNFVRVSLRVKFLGLRRSLEVYICWSSLTESFGTSELEIRVDDSRMESTKAGWNSASLGRS
eukprot:TRINITY_DN17265_c0_g1_i1.p1 TRINITY_DN17265_c0_g1~~TRINITY_DN17265_c0_g1_i1.p1  ORF type:complete len:92 (+),score=6.49 TRINITY_DN17265_c0_g1_i1:232-507(+)